MCSASLLFSVVLLLGLLLLLLLLGGVAEVARPVFGGEADVQPRGDHEGDRPVQQSLPVKQWRGREEESNDAVRQ